MRSLALLAAGLFTGSLLVGCGPVATNTTAVDTKGERKDEKKPRDEDAILGTWELIKYDFDADTPPRSQFEMAMRLTFKKEGRVVMFGREPSDKEAKEEELDYKLDPAATPKTLDVTGDGKSVPSLYELEADKLTICSQQYAPKGEMLTRPDAIKADANKGVIVLTLKRRKDKKDN